ncbi:MAG: GNAT family N-acetyltransferase [Acidobacteria bacterium]|nr:GNAT family N-acetyltransferase [Acidobacteriota bacterium]
MPVLIRRLQEADAVEQFDCGDERLNNYLRRHAWTNQAKSSIGVTYVAMEESALGVVVGYFTLATASTPRDSLPRKHVRGLPAYDLPVILLARLAVDHRFVGQGLGKRLLSEALRISLRVSRDVGCRCILTDAYQDRVSWYAKYGFLPLAGTLDDGTQRMFLDIRTVLGAAGKE